VVQRGVRMSESDQNSAEIDGSAGESRDLPEYNISAEISDRHVSIEYNGVTIVDSKKAVLYTESRMPTVYYFPREDVRMDLMRRSRFRTHCPFKGNASYWTLEVGEKTIEDAVWSYESPLPEADGIKGHLAFYLSKLGVSYNEDGEYTEAHSEFDSHGSPFVDWLMREGWDTSSPSDLTGQLGDVLLQSGMDVSRMSVFIRTLHPLLIGSAYVWRSDKDDVNSFVLTHDTLSSPLFLDSPLVPIFNGAGGIRRRLEGENPLLDYGIIKQLHNEGMTDYAAMPMTFSDGQINALTMSTSKAGGFSTAELGRVHEILPVLSRFYEVHAARSMSNSLLQTYLGRHTGEKVMKGLIKRGDSEELHAVIWFCDLRQSTPLAESMPREEFLELLNHFFECMVKPVVEYGGEVLRFIGDAVLAVFPLLDGDSIYQRACDDALSAATEAEKRMKTYNAEREAAGLQTLDFGIGLHLGRLTYGNIGIPERLEFTVIGAAANEAARIEALTKEIDYSVVVSSAFADRCSSPLTPVGEFELRGVRKKQTIYVPEELPGF
jgi:adenylate cyclase